MRSIHLAAVRAAVVVAFISISLARWGCWLVVDPPGPPTAEAVGDPSGSLDLRAHRVVRAVRLVAERQLVGLGCAGLAGDVRLAVDLVRPPGGGLGRLARPAGVDAGERGVDVVEAVVGDLEHLVLPVGWGCCLRGPRRSRTSVRAAVEVSR